VTDCTGSPGSSSVKPFDACLSVTSTTWEKYTQVFPPPSSPPVSPPSPPAALDDGSQPCFADATTVCRLHDAAVPVATAFAQCFGVEAPSRAERMAERVLMKELIAGDFVLASHADATRVVVNQHVGASKVSMVLTLEHEHGSLSLTPDHVLLVDGAFQPASKVSVGSYLEPISKVTKVTTSQQGIISPITASGRILAAGAEGEPVVATVWPEWIADLMLGSAAYPLPFSLSTAASYCFPEAVQAYYNAILEPVLSTATGSLKLAKAALPVPVAFLAMLAIDFALVGSFALWAALSFKGATAVIAVLALTKLQRAK